MNITTTIKGNWSLSRHIDGFKPNHRCGNVNSELFLTQLLYERSGLLFTGWSRFHVMLSQLLCRLTFRSIWLNNVTNLTSCKWQTFFCLPEKVGRLGAGLLGRATTWPRHHMCVNRLFSGILQLPRLSCRPSTLDGPQPGPSARSIKPSRSLGTLASYISKALWVGDAVCGCFCRSLTNAFFISITLVKSLESSR